jgi:hypothetical protein
MQTFVPYESFHESASMLDSKRLNKQILEGYQILKVLGNPDPRAAWRNHPAVKMWRGREHGLFFYLQAMIKEAKFRGIKTDKNEANILSIKKQNGKFWGSGMPSWYSNKEELLRVTDSHKANLYRKDPEYYAAFSHFEAKPCCDRCQYYWPTHLQDAVV